MDAYFAPGRIAKPRPAALETYRAALASARAFERIHPGLPGCASRVLSRARLMQVGDLAPDEALDLFTEARSRIEPMAKENPSDFFAALEGSVAHSSGTTTSWARWPASAGLCKWPKPTETSAIWHPPTSG